MCLYAENNSKNKKLNKRKKSEQGVRRKKIVNEKETDRKERERDGEKARW